MLWIRHSSLYAPRDFDVLPYFQIVKAALVKNFNYKFTDWVDLPASAAMQNDEAITSATATDSTLTSSDPHGNVMQELL
jgi:hypothetical protein